MLPISRGRLALAGAFALAFSLSFFTEAARAQMQPAARPHVHGVASVDVAVDTASITVTMSSPLDNLVGFEHPPRTDGVRSAANAAVAALRQGDKIDPAAGCTLKSLDPRLGQSQFYRDEGDNAWWTHASTPGTH